MITTKKYVITIVLLLAIAVGSLFEGMKLGAKGYTYSGNDYKIVNQNETYKTVDYSLLWEALDTLNTKYIDRPLDQHKLMLGAVAGMVAAAGDPYTTFFDAEHYKDFQTELKGSFDGIGAEVDSKDGNIVIVAPIDGTPAKAAGILAGDIIIKINGEDTLNMTVDQAVSKIRGKKGTVVTLGIFRPATKKQIEFKITRDKIEIVPVKWATKDINGKKVEVITISRFGDETVNLFTQAAQDALNKKVNGIILDLRDDPGGYLDGAVAVSSFWVKQGDVVVSEQQNDPKDKDKKVVQDSFATGNNILSSIPTIVMINGGSASASEIVSGALHDHDMAKLLGTKSFGKGSVQELVNLSQQTALKVTIAKWLTPKGININKNGLEPDIKVEITPEQIEAKQDPQLDKALELLTK